MLKGIFLILFFSFCAVLGLFVFLIFLSALFEFIGTISTWKVDWHRGKRYKIPMIKGDKPTITHILRMKLGVEDDVANDIADTIIGNLKPYRKKKGER